MRKRDVDLYETDLFNAELPDVANPLQPRRPPPNVPLNRATRDAVEDALEANAPDGISWAWDLYESPFVNACVLLVLSDCRYDDGATVGLLLSDDPERDARNVQLRCNAFRVRARRERKINTSAA